MPWNTVAIDYGVESPPAVIYALLRDQNDARYWNGSGVEFYSLAHYSTYPVLLVEEGGSGQSGIYILTIPASLPDGTWDILPRLKLTGSYLDSDPPAAASGSVVVVDGVIVAPGTPSTPPVLSSTDLTWRQNLQFGDVCDIFRRSFAVDGRGKQVAPTWSVVARGVRYEHASTRNFSQPSIGGRVVQPSSISVELGYFAVSVDIRDQDMIRNTGSMDGKNPLAGNVYRVLGASTRFSDTFIRDANDLNVELRQEPKPPLGLPS